MRQKFTAYERDNETGLDFAQARYFTSSQGRFTSADPLMASAKQVNPQTWNRYSYVGNNPMVFADPSGMARGPGSFYANNPEIQHAQEVGSMEVEAAESSYEARINGYYDEIVEAEPIDGSLESEDAVPQGNLIQDDPETIQSENNTKSCSFTISFKSGVFYEENKNYPNGPGMIVVWGKKLFGLGFTVSGTVLGGRGIGIIGAEQNPENPKGKWHLDQWTSSYAKQDGQFVKIEGRIQNGGEAWRDISTKGIYNATSSSKFSRYDFPSLKDNKTTFKNQSFFIKVTNGNKVCQASFHIIQQGNSVHWGRGGTGNWPQH